MRMNPQRGAILLVVLVMLAVVALFSVSALTSVSNQQARANETELLFVGEQYRRAIDSYLVTSPGGVRQFPARLEDLVNDRRFVQPRHHLRKLFADPVNPNQPWAPIMVGNSLVGVHSQSTSQPFQKVGFSDSQRGFESARTYADWAFKSDLVAPQAPSLRGQEAPSQPLR